MSTVFASVIMWALACSFGFVLGRKRLQKDMDRMSRSLDELDNRINACESLFKAVKEVKEHACEVCKVNPQACITRTNLEKAVEVYQKRADLIFGKR